MSTSSSSNILLSRALFNELSLNLFSFLESVIGVDSESITFEERFPVSSKDVEQWEKENSPIVLPNDLKSFLNLSDGLSVHWNYRLCDESYPLGQMNLNSIQQMKKVYPELVKSLKQGQSVSEADEQSDDEQILPKKSISSSISSISSIPCRNSSFPIAFELDSACDGLVCLVYFSAQMSEIWFLDLGGNWTRLSATFLDYFRLLIMHLGLPRWPWAFTKIGIDPICKCWMQFMAPQRMEIDNKWRKKINQIKKNTKKTVQTMETIQIQQQKNGTLKTKRKGLNLSKIDKYAKSLTSAGSKAVVEKYANEAKNTHTPPNLNNSNSAVSQSIAKKNTSSNSNLFL